MRAMVFRIVKEKEPVLKNRIIKKPSMGSGTFRRVLLTSLILIALNQLCDNGWFIIGRYTEVHLWMVEIGILFWSIVGGLVLEKYLHNFIHKKIHKGEH